MHGGVIPGLPAYAAFRTVQPDPASIPVVLAAPHAGRCYPADLLAALRVPRHVLLRLEDRLIDCVADAVARETGAPIIIAQAPRAMIDLNRALDDIDWDMLVDGPRLALSRGVGALGHPGSGHRARSGLGLVPRRLPGAGELWKMRLAYGDLVQRIESIHQPYHTALAGLVEAVRRQWGAALLIDLHSMPPLAGHGRPAPKCVIGDRFGTACDGELIASLFTCLAGAGLPLAHNRPYAGGFVLDRHARRSTGVHAVQIEICRSVYLDAGLVEPGPGFDAVVAMLVAMVRQLADDVAALGRDRLRWRSAAE